MAVAQLEFVRRHPCVYDFTPSIQTFESGADYFRPTCFYSGVCGRFLGGQLFSQQMAEDCSGGDLLSVVWSSIVELYFSMAATIHSPPPTEQAWQREVSYDDFAA